jgi:adsorption protein B
MGWLDCQLAEWLVPLAVWVLTSGLDDCFLDLAYIHRWFRARRRADGAYAFDPPDLERGAEPAIAILVPCWQEAGVIEQMLDSNLTAIEYQDYDVWLGVYPNDQPTIDRVAACEAKFARVRHVVCPHDGPTTKADCLNWLYHGVRAFEVQAGRRYELFLQHDAEDVIHPESLRLVARESARWGMMQLPVFALPTPLRLLTHGVYADEFAEFHFKDLYVRGELGGFIPSAGVGTAYRREVLEALEGQNAGQVFDPESLTEDYFIGLRIHSLGFTQKLLKVLAHRPFGPDGITPTGGRVKSFVAL